MPIEQSITVVDNAGNVVWRADGAAPKDGSGRIAHPGIFIYERLAPTPLAAFMWTCQEGIWRVRNVTASVSVTGGAACTCDVLVCGAGVAPGSGTTQLTAVLDIEATAPFNVQGTLIATPTQMFPGMTLARVIAGTVGSIEGRLTVHLERIQ